MHMDVFTALATPTRRNIIEILAAKGALPASDIYDKFDASPPAISQHLKALHDVGLVRMKKRGRQHIYELDTEGIDALELWTQKITFLWNKRLDTLNMVLEAEKRKQSIQK